MANISIRRNGGQPATTTPEWDPFRAMREMMRWDPFREMAPILAGEPVGFNPAFDVKETKDAFIFRADLPGVKAADLSVTLDGLRLQVSGKRETDHEEKTDTYYSYERSFGSFMRAFTLPQGADAKAVRADLDEGVLTITIGKSPEAQPRKIAVASGAGKHKS